MNQITRLHQKSIVAILIIFFSQFSFSQSKYSEGTIDFGLISATVIDSTNLIETNKTLDQLIPVVESQFNFEFAWKKNYAVIQKNDPELRDTTRTVIDLPNKLVYLFKNGISSQVFTVDAFPEMDADAIPPFPPSEPCAELISGLTCTKVTISPNTDQSVEMLCSNEIDLSMYPTLSLLMSNHGIMARSKMQIRGIEIIYGIKSFEPVIKDHSIFAIDSSGISNLTDVRDAMATVFSNDEKESRKVKRKFGPYSPEGRNQDILKKLTDDQILDPTGYYIANTVDEKLDIDKVTILHTLLKYSDFIEKEALPLQLILEKYSLNSPSMENFLKASDTQSKWSNLSNELKANAIVVSFFNDYMEQESIKNQIINNLISADLISDKSIAVSEKYKEGNAGLHELLATMDQFIFLPLEFTLSDEALFNKIKDFYLLIKDKVPSIKITRDQDKVSVSDGTFTHSLSLNELKNIDYDNSDYSSPNNSKTVYLDTTFIDMNFYNDLISIMKQMEVDNHLNTSISIYKLPQLVHHDIGESALNEVFREFPKLQTQPTYIFLNQFTKEKLDPYHKFGISFEYHPHSENDEIRLNHLFIGDYDNEIVYLTTTLKKNFLDYLSNYASDYRLDENDLQNYSEQVLYSTIIKKNDLLRYLKFAKLPTYSRRKITPKNEYSPLFDDDNNEFKDGYPGLVEYFGDDFQATNFSYDSEAHKVSFQYDGDSFTIDPGVNQMFHFIREHQPKGPSGKQIFSNKIIRYKKYFYYLTQKQANDLSSILDITFKLDR